MASENIVVSSDANFRRDVLDSAIPVVVDFWAVHCRPCHMVAPLLEELADTYKDKIKVVKLNVTENMSTAGDYRIHNIPTLLAFKDGKVVNQIVGFNTPLIKSMFEAL